MTHYTVLVALPGEVEPADVESALSQALAPYDENKATDPYRDYVEEHAAFAERLGAVADWQTVVALHNCDESNDPLYYDEETGRAFSMSTYNPDSKWDWYSIGGRWAGYFPVAEGADPDNLLRAAPRRSMVEMDRCDGGRKRDLDLAALRAQHRAEADKDLADYREIVEGTEPALPWPVIVERVDRSGNGGYSIEAARRDYAAQPRVAAVGKSARFDTTFVDPIETFDSMTREQYLARQESWAVPGYATLDAVNGGGWIAPGRMGQFGMASEEGSYAEYVARANKLVDELPDDAWLIVVDCHI